MTKLFGDMLKREFEVAWMPNYSQPKPPGDEILNRVRRKQRRASKPKLKFLDWANLIPEPKTGTLDFGVFPMQVELYSEHMARCHDAVVMKGTQVGISAWLVRWVMYWADQANKSALYVQPKDKFLGDFCVAEGERVLLADGGTKPIEKVQAGDEVLSFDGEKIVADQVAAAWASGYRPVVRVRLAGGRTIRVTRAHRVLTQRGWVRAGALVREDQVCVPRQLPEPATSRPRARTHRPHTRKLCACFSPSASQRESRARIAAIGVPGKSVVVGEARGYARPSVQAEAGGHGWARVLSVEDDGEVETYDLETVETHAFFLEGALTHNSNARIRPLITGSPYLSSKVPVEHVNNVYQRQIGGGWLYLRGTQNKDSLDAVDADVLGLDEYDSLVQANIPDAERRVSSPLSQGLIRRVGVPSMPNYGISRLYAESDQRVWLVKCTFCKEGWQEISFWNNVDQTQMKVVCSNCARVLPVADGQWVAKFPDRSVPGYHVTRLIVPNVRLDGIVKASKLRTPYEVQTFHNKDLGVDYVPAEGRLTPEHLAAAQREFSIVPGYVGPEPVTMGVDTASARALHVRISLHDADLSRRRALFIGRADSFDEIAALMERYDVKKACIDEAPEGRLARALTNQFPGRVYTVRAPSNQTEVFKVDEDVRRVSVRRVEALDACLEAVRAQRNQLPIHLPEGYAEQMMNMVRRIDKNEIGVKLVEYVPTGDVDYLMAELYDLAAKELFVVHAQVAEDLREMHVPLDEMLEFQRSNVADPENMDLSAGPGDDEYHPGFDEDA